MSKPSHDPRPYLMREDDTYMISLGDFDADGFSSGKSYDETDILRKLTREQKADFKQARQEGFHPVLLIDMETGVVVLEMRKHAGSPMSHRRDGV